MFPQIQSHRFDLLQFCPCDLDFVFEGLSHPEVIRYYGVNFHSLEATKVQMEWYNNLLTERTGIWWKIVNRQTNERVGAIGMNNYQQQHKRTEIGYWLLPQFWKQGIISEVLPVVTNHLFTKEGVHRIEALVEEGNEGSCNVLRKAGFHFEGKMRECEIKNGNYISLLMFSLLFTDTRPPLHHYTNIPIS
jgi:[ribosomal protein S5]-alanine N-acetyltransferase